MDTALDEARQFAGDVLYAKPEQLDALVLASAASHLMDVWDTVPRLLFTSENGRAGKTTALDVFGYLSNNSWLSTGATGPSIRSKFNEPTVPTVLSDEVTSVFGTSGRNGNASDLARLARDGYRRTGTLSMSVGRSTENVPAFCMLAMAGLKTAVPEDIRSRCIVFAMKPKPANAAPTLDSVSPDTEALAHVINATLHQRVRALRDEIVANKRSFSPPHFKFRDRPAQIWTSLFLTAEAVGGDWPKRCLAAFSTMALDIDEQRKLTVSQMMLRDSAMAFLATPTARSLTNREIRDFLLSLPESPLWSTLSDDMLSKEMQRALGDRVRLSGEGRPWGRHARTVLAKWQELETELLLLDTPPEPPVSEFADDFS